MGNDGGTIAKRQDILSLHSYGKNGDNEKVQIVDDDENSDLTKCALSSSQLYGPEDPVIVSDYKGKLYDKLEVLKYMLKEKSSNKDFIDTNGSGVSKMSPFNHLRSLRDIVDVHINWKLNSAGGRPTIECPVTKELNGNTVYAYLRTCGCVLSFKVLEELDKYFAEKNNKSDNQLKDFDCPNCGELFSFKHDVVILNPRDVKGRAEFNKRSYQLLQDLQLTHSKKPMKTKKKKKDKSEPNGLSDSKKRREDADETTNLTKKTKI